MLEKHDHMALHGQHWTEIFLEGEYLAESATHIDGAATPYNNYYIVLLWCVIWYVFMKITKCWMSDVSEARSLGNQSMYTALQALLYSESGMPVSQSRNSTCFAVQHI